MSGRACAGYGDIARFAATARPGEAMAYARGDAPPRELVDAMRSLVESGVLAPVRKREGGEFLFMVQRSGGATGQRRSGRRGTVRRKRIARTSLSAVFDVLARAAKRGEACPTNEELAAICGLSGKLAASYRMRCLVRSGRIAVEDRSPFGRRVVTILAGPQAGRATAEAWL